MGSGLCNNQGASAFGGSKSLISTCSQASKMPLTVQARLCSCDARFVAARRLFRPFSAAMPLRMKSS